MKNHHPWQERVEFLSGNGSEPARRNKNLPPTAAAHQSFFFPGLETGMVLDYGCGPGALIVTLEHNFARVYATDLTLERAQFTRMRAEQENLHNVTPYLKKKT